MFSIGELVRFDPKWCTEEELSLIHVIREVRLNPVKNTESRYLIETINGAKYLNGLNPTTVVDDFMIQKI